MSRKVLAWMVLADAAILGLAIWLVIGRVLPERQTFLAVPPFLLVSNLLLLKRLSVRGQSSSRKGRIPVLAWIGLGLYTVAALVGVGALLTKPLGPSSFGVLVVIGLAVYLWWLVLRVRGMTETRERSISGE